MGKRCWRAKLPDIYFELEEGCKRTWHVIKLSSSSEEEADDDDKLSVELVDANIPQYPLNTSLSATAVVGGSKIYVCGGISCDRPYFTVTNKVYYVDVNDPHPQWKEAPPMICSRRRPYGFAYQDKIYVVSGLNPSSPPVDEVDGTLLYAEVYDPNSPEKEGWKVIARSEPDIESLQPVLAHAPILHNSNHKILFHSHRLSCLRGLLLGSPYIFNSCHTIPSTVSALACLDGIIYYIDNWNHSGKLFAYNVDDPSNDYKLVKFTNTVIEGTLPFPVRDPWGEGCRLIRCPPTRLLALDNKNLAVIWSHDTFDGNRVYCSVIEVSKC